MVLYGINYGYNKKNYNFSVFGNHNLYICLEDIMKKKITLFALSMTMLFGLTACGDKENKDNENTTIETTEEAVNITDSLEILTTVWGTYGADEMFAIMGGDYNNMVNDAPGTFDVSDAESLDSILGVPADAASLIDGAASMVHMMNANTFTGGSYHLSDSANMEDFTAKLKDNIVNRQWMCGFPDTLIIVSIGDEYVVSAFGEAGIIENFKTKLSGVYPMCEVLYEENLAQ